MALTCRLMGHYYTPDTGRCIRCPAQRADPFRPWS
jgi:hypothetical protein